VAKKVSAEAFAKFCYQQYKEKAGYILGSYGQNPKKWSINSWWFQQYKSNAKQYKQALYWREHAKRVFDCQGLSEGYYLDQTKTNVDTKARYNYAQWCSPKGKGLIPASFRVPGAAVFWSDSGASSIHHVAYLYKPVDANKPGGDWYLIEARGVMYGVVLTKLNARKPNFWGWMTKYFDYDQPNLEPAPAPSNELKHGDEGSAVKQMQTNLIRLGYDCGKWGADGDFGDATEIALKKFQKDHGIGADGIYGEKTEAAMDKALADMEQPHDNPKSVEIYGGNCYVRSAPSTSGKIMGVVTAGTKLPYGGESTETGWHLVEYKGENGWVSGKYSKVLG
jgi:Putative peptidoglycan-binding domain-containing protein